VTAHTQTTHAIHALPAVYWIPSPIPYWTECGFIGGCSAFRDARLTLLDISLSRYPGTSVASLPTPPHTFHPHLTTFFLTPSHLPPVVLLHFRSIARRGSSSQAQTPFDILRHPTHRHPESRLHQPPQPRRRDVVGARRGCSRGDGTGSGPDRKGEVGGVGVEGERAGLSG
jgi:hypothetical protein